MRVRMQRGLPEAAAVLAATVLAVGCAPTLTQTARTNGAGRLQVAVEPGVSVTGFEDARVTTPSVDLSARYGVTDAVDVGLRVGPYLGELQTKVMLTDPSARDGVAVAVAPTLTLLAGNALGLGSFFGRLTVPLVVDVPVGSHRFVGGARLSQVVAPGDAGGANQGWQLSAGVSGGFAFSLGSLVQLLPEVGIDVPVLGVATALPGPRAPQLGFRVGVLFGGSTNRSGGAK
jgi:hypothetical protein